MSPIAAHAEEVALAREVAPEEGEHEEHARRDRGEQPGLFSSHQLSCAPYHFRIAASSTLAVARLRNRRMTIASARPTSAAATVMTKTAKITPVMLVGIEVGGEGDEVHG